MAKYLYNGHEFPELPNLQGQYACILSTTYEYQYAGTFLVVSTSTFKFTQGSLQPFTQPISSTASTVYYKVSDSQWVQIDRPTYVGSRPLWTNHDIINRTTGDNYGSVYLAASDPIPVVTAHQLDPLSLWLGYQAGQWVARQRGKA